jgi:hypothetical protein
MKFTIRHTFEIDADKYWEKVFFNPDYNRRLYQEVLKFKGYEVLELRDQGGGAWIRKLRMEPGFEAPAVIKKILGDKVTYVETGRFDPVKKRWHYDVTPSVLVDRVKIGGDFWVEPRGPNRLERIAEMEIVAKILGVGGVLESYIEKETRQSYDKAAAFTNEFIRTISS